MSLLATVTAAISSVFTPAPPPPRVFSVYDHKTDFDARIRALQPPVDNESFQIVLEDMTYDPKTKKYAWGPELVVYAASEDVERIRAVLPERVPVSYYHVDVQVEPLVNTYYGCYDPRAPNDPRLLSRGEWLAVCRDMGID